MGIKKIIAFFVCLVSIQIASAQRVMLVDSDFIMENVPEFKEAQEKLNSLSKQWQGEIESRYKAISEMKSAYQAELVLLTNEMRENRLAEIEVKEKEVIELQQAKFGTDGELFKKNQELVQPVQEKLYTAIKDVAESGNYDLVIDKATQNSVLYSDPKLDKSLTVLRKMGVKLSSN
jgi:outer membrane protein